MTVGGDHLQAVLLQLHQRAVELEARLLGRNGEDHLADHALELPKRQSHRGRAVDFRQGREVIRRQAVDGESRAAGGDLQPVLVGELEHHLVTDDGADDLEELTGLNGDTALALDLRLAPGGQGDIEIRRGHLEPVLTALEQQMGEHRYGGSTLDDSLHRGELVQEF